MADEEQVDQGEPWQWHNKACRSDYNPPPFYYWDDEIPDCARLVAWSLDCRQMRAALMALLDTFPPRVDILLKRREIDPDAHNYERWHGNKAWRP